MVLSRRNLLLGMVVLVLGAGVIGASGAFSSVQAERTMDIQTAGDSSALLGLSADDSEIAGTEGASGDSSVNVLKIANSQINEDAITKFGPAFTATNNGNDDIGSFYIKAKPGIGLAAGGSGPVDFRANGQSIVGSTNSVSLGAQGGTVTVDVVIDTTGSASQSDLPSSGTITIVAEQGGGGGGGGGGT